MTIKNILNFGSDIFAHGAILSIIYIVAVFVVAKIVQKLIRKSIDRFEKKSKRENEMIFVMADHIVKYVVYTIATILAFYELIPFKTFGSALVGLSSVITVVIALATQEFAGNLVSGAVISAYQPFKVGDLIKLPEKNIMGTIEDMNFRHVLIRTLDNSVLLIPNKTINEAIVENRAGGDNEPLRNVYYYDISYDSDFNLAKELILDYLNKSERVDHNKPISVNVVELAASSIKLRVVSYSASAGIGFDLMTELNEYVLTEFAKNKIEIPYQYVNVINK